MLCECHNRQMHKLPWGGYRCRHALKDRNRKEVVLEALLRGNKCENPNCDTKNHLEWHHREPSKKFKDISRMVSERSGIRALRAELAKCDLLCHSCHGKAQRKVGKKNVQTI